MRNKLIAAAGALVVLASPVAQAQEGGATASVVERDSQGRATKVAADGRVRGPDRAVGLRSARHTLNKSKLDQLAQAVVDVEPHAAERGHQCVGVECVAGARAQEAQ